MDDGRGLYPEQARLGAWPGRGGKRELAALAPPLPWGSPLPRRSGMPPGGFSSPPPPQLLLWGSRLGRGARRALLRGALGFCLALLLLWAAIFLYGSFYWAWLPAAAVVRPLPLRFSSDCERPGPELCSFPTANVSLLGEHREKVLLYGQLYRISVELELPESPVNRDLGMFMVSLTCYGQGGRVLASAARAAMLHYRSRLLRALHTFAFAGFFLSGFAEQSQTLELELLGRYREDPYLPTVGALVEIRSRRVQLYGAKLRVHAHFTGLRYLLYHFPLTSAVLGVAGNWTLLALLTLGGYLQWGRGERRPRPLRQDLQSDGGTTKEGEGTDLSASSQNLEEPEILGASEPSEDPPLLSAANAPPPKEEEEKGEGWVGEGQEEEGVTPTPLPPLPDGPSPRQRHVCSSS